MPNFFQNKNFYTFRARLDQKYQRLQCIIDFVEFADLHLTLLPSWRNEYYVVINIAKLLRIMCSSTLSI